MNLVNLKTIHLSFALALSLFLISSSCKKDNPPTPSEPQLPAITTTGKNTFGCYIDEDLYLPKGGAYYRAIEFPSYHEIPGRLDILTLNQKDQTDWLKVIIFIKEGVFGTGIFTNVGDSLDPLFRVYKDGNPPSEILEYYVDTTKTRFVEITRLDFENKIVSGIFEFTVVNNTYHDTIFINQGRFDLRDLVVQP